MIYQEQTNHFAIVLDASSSMYPVANTLVKVADDYIQFLAKRSDELKQETRISVYVFADRVKCLIWDMDVLRLPSIRDLYRANGWTALVDATMITLEDLATIPQKYGDHAFLVSVLTDGHENASRTYSIGQLEDKLKAVAQLPNWTVAAFVPDKKAETAALRAGFPAGNVALWDATTKEGVVKASATLTTATDTYMTTKTKSTRNLFTAAVVTRQDVQAANLTPVNPSMYLVLPVIRKSEIKAFVEEHGRRYVTGRGFYQLSKHEEIQGNKEIMLLEKATNRLFSGQSARELIGLPAHNVRISPNDHKEFRIFVRSDSHNRHLMPGTDFVYMLV